MTTTAKLDKGPDHPVSAVLRRTRANLGTSLAILVRAPRGAGDRLRLLPAAGPLSIALAATIVAIGAAMIFVDARAIAIAQRLPYSVNNAFEQITDFGLSGWFLWPAAAVTVVIAALASERLGRTANLVLVAVMVRVEFVFFAIALPGLVITIGKHLIGRVRPSEFGPFAYEPFSWRPEFASIPSGHSTTAFSAAIAIGALFPRARVPMWIYALVIAASRVIVQAHFPSDVIAGAFVGTLGALMVRNAFAARRLAFTVGADRKVRPWPGLSPQRLKRVARAIFSR
jgi:membrane-associated phospholipid phosphatase